jgi:peroxiredoxin/uncharacterized membrane protein YphA (DoxX/SURF4 family)
MLPLLRIALAGIFALAGITKLLDRDGTRRSLADFGASDALVPMASVGLPAAELAVAVALLPAATAVYGALGAAALLLAFVAAIAANLLRGRRPDCHCFGQLHSTPIGWPLLVRNAAMLTAALAVAAAGWPDGGGSLVAWFQGLSGTVGVVLAGALLAIGVLSVRRLKRREKPAPPDYADLMAAALPVGSRAPGFALPGLDGSTMTLEMALGEGKPVVLVFTDPNCHSCTELLPDIERWQQDHADAATLVVVSGGTLEANRAKLAGRAIRRVLLQTNREVADAFGVKVTPGALLVRPDGTIGSHAALGDGGVVRLMGEIVGSPAAAPALHAQAKDFTLVDLQGQLVSLAQFRGRPTVLLFWDPGCTHCQQLLGHLRLWEARPAAARAELLVVSKGDVDANAGLGFRSTIVLDRTYRVGSQYGLPGTPSAVLIDEAGRVASAPAIGGAAILELIGQPELPPAPFNCPEEPMEGEPVESATTLEAGSRPLRQECVHDELLADGSLLLYNSCRRQVLTLNPTGALVWEYCDGEHDVDAIVGEVTGVFPSATTAARDVRAVLDSLLQAGLIAARPTAAAGAVAPTL